MSILHRTLEHACMCYPAYFHARKTLKFNYAIACTKFLAVKLQCLLAPRCQASVANLNEDIQRYIDLSVAASTKQTYSAGEKRFIAFCNLYRPQQAERCLPLPASEGTLIKSSVYLAKSIKHSLIEELFGSRSSLSHPVWFKIGFSKTVTSQLVLRGIKHSQ